MDKREILKAQVDKILGGRRVISIEDYDKIAELEYSYIEYIGVTYYNNGWVYSYIVYYDYGCFIDSEEELANFLVGYEEEV